jgi:NAD(P)-dependent dehydrogenase (short-subunit alcohol dehydrogenase family)
MDTYTIITGATSGIGLDLSKRLAKERNVILVGRNQDKLDFAISQVSDKHHVLGFACDLDSDRKAIATQLSEFILTNSIQIDSFVHCAGTSKVMAIRQAVTESVDTIFNVNILSAIEFIKLLLKKENKGALRNILLISSLASVRGEKGNSIYAASKGALNSLAVTLAKELAPKVRVNSISPGTVETPMTQDFIATETGEKHLKDYPLGVGHCEDITNLACFLLSDSARWITGQNIIIDGGRSTL